MIAAEDFVNEVQSDFSRKNVHRVAARAADDGLDLKDLLSRISLSSQPLKWRLCWALSHSVSHGLQLNDDQVELIWQFTKEVSHEGMLRDLWRIMSYVKVSERFAGEVFDTGITLLKSEKFPAAVRVNAMQTAFNIAENYPELMMEFRMSLLDLSMSCAPSIRARQRMLLKKDQRVN